MAFCRDKRPDLDPHRVFEQFRDYWISTPKNHGKKYDWLATWRNWVRNEKRVTSSRPAAPKNPDWWPA